MIDSGLKFEKHINGKIEVANKILGIIRRSYQFLDSDIFVPLYKALIRSRFDYAVTVWNPSMVKYIEAIESVQRRATKMVPDLKKISLSRTLKGTKSSYTYIQTCKRRYDRGIQNSQ